MEESKLNGVIISSLQKIKEMIDANTVLGNPVSVKDVTIIPVSKVSVGYASGGVDFFGKNVKGVNDANFGGGGGTGVSILPLGFLVIKDDGYTEYLPVSKSSSTNGPAAAPEKIDKVISFIERSPDYLEKILNLLKKEEKESNKES